MLSGYAQKGSIRTFTDEYNLTAVIRYRSANATSNSAEFHCTTFNIGERSTVDFALCRFRSNYPCNTLLLYLSAADEEVYRCLEFYNNSASVGDDKFRGLISTAVDCRFEDCTFVENKAIALIGQSGTELTVELVRCIFDEWPSIMSTLGVALQTVDCVARPDVPDAADSGHCPTPDPRQYCARNNCGGYCPAVLIIDGCIFEKCTCHDDGSGGALLILTEECQLRISASEFIQCWVSWPGRAGGAIYVRECERAIIVRCIGDRCAATQGEVSFCMIGAAALNGLIEMNETTAFSGWATRGSIRTSSADLIAPTLIRYRLVNATANAAEDHCTTFNIGERSNLDFSFCRLQSNYPCNTLLLYVSAAEEEVYHCLEFCNNSAVVGNDDFRGLISTAASCQFEDCTFVRNKAIAVIGQSSGTRTVALVRCIFDEWPLIWSTLGVAVETAECSARLDVSDTVDSARCPTPDPRPYCTRYDCFQECPDIVVITNCIFDTMKASDKGGAIFIYGETSRLLLPGCRFIRCYALTSGGSVWFRGTDAKIVSYVGMNSAINPGSGGGGTNVWLLIESAAAGTAHLNESTAVLGAGNVGTFRIGVDSSGLPSVTSSVNTSENQASSGTGIYFVACYSRIIQFCHFASNLPTSVLCLEVSTISIDEFLCLDFVNNSCTQSSTWTDQEKCLICVWCDCAFRQCLFLGNAMTYLAGGWATSLTVTFSSCILDREMSDSFYSVTFDLVECEVRSDSAIRDSGMTCPWIAATEPAENPSASFTAPSYIRRRRDFMTILFFLVAF
jgi:hypothetical protein